MSDYAYKMASKHAPRSIPEDAFVAGSPAKHRGEEFLQTLHGLRTTALELDSKTRKMDPGYMGSPLANTLSEAIYHHQNKGFYNIKSVLTQANSHAHKAVDHLRGLDHPDADSVKNQMYDLQDRLIQATY
jgi:hypothetical protein